MKTRSPKGLAIGLGLCLFVAPSAKAQDTVETSSSILAIDLEVQSNAAMADWLEALVWQGALDGPYSGGPGDVQQHIDILRTTPPSSVASISNGFFWVIDPGFEAQLQAIASANLPAEIFDQEVEQVVWDLLIVSGAPILDVNISNGI